MQKKTEARTLAALERERERESYTLKNKKINKVNIKNKTKPI